MKKIIILLCIVCAISTACKKSGTDTTSNGGNCTTKKICTVAFTNDYSSALDIKVYDAGSNLRLTITGLAAGSSITRDTVPAGDVIVRWSGGTLTGTLSHFYTYTACQSYTEKYYTTLPSDARYKKNIDAIEGSNALQNLLLLKPRSYEYDFLKFPSLDAVQGKTNGFIAQDIEKIFPEVVVKNPEGYRSVNYAALIPVLTAAIQEQQLQIKQLKKDIVVLSNRK
jgi:Chaperone of endosialidase